MGLRAPLSDSLSTYERSPMAEFSATRFRRQSTRKQRRYDKEVPLCVARRGSPHARQRHCRCRGGYHRAPRTARRTSGSRACGSCGICLGPRPLALGGGWVCLGARALATGASRASLDTRPLDPVRCELALDPRPLELNAANKTERQPQPLLPCSCKRECRQLETSISLATTLVLEK